MRLYHNPRCSKSRQAVTLLTESGADFEDYRYLSEGIHSDDIEILSSLPGILRRKDVIGSFDFGNLDSGAIKELLLEQPKCLERPVLVFNGKAVIGRPPEKILEFLHHQ
ncbi:MAG: ArsC/Spx/MgsR family protein [Candidatus Poseidoniaceae archaeon]